jgi:hypothetical protein
VILAGGASVASAAVGINADVARSNGAVVATASDGGMVLDVGIAARLSADNSIDWPHPVSLFADVGTSSSSRACFGGSGSSDVAFGDGGASHRNATPKKTAVVAAATMQRGRRWSGNRKSRLVTALIVESWASIVAQQTGLYFNGLHEAKAQAQAYDPDARRQLEALSLELTGLSAEGCGCPGAIALSRAGFMRGARR